MNLVLTPAPGARRGEPETMSLLAKHFGAKVVLPTVATFEQVDQGDYDDQPETKGTGMRDQERSHARVLTPRRRWIPLKA